MSDANPTHPDDARARTPGATRRPNGAGSIGHRDDGAIVVRATGPDGKRHKRIVARGTRDDGRPETPSQHWKRAEKALAELRRQLKEPTTLREKWTLDKYFAERYCPSVAERLRPRTYESYVNEWKLFVAPYVGGVELARLDVDVVDQLDRTLADKGYSLAVRRKSRGLLSRTCRHAVSKGRLRHNPCTDADRLASDDRDRTKGSLEPDQVRSLLVAARDCEDGAWLAPTALLALGLRRGEVLGLAWSSVDVDAGTVRVERSMATLRSGRNVLTLPKNAGSRRSLSASPSLVTALRAHRKRVAEWQLSAGSAWSESVVDDAGESVQLVCVDEAGRALPPHRLNDALDRIAAVAGVGKVNPHKLRHSAASLMLAEGMDIPSVAAVLGHASPAVTMSVYAHAVGRSDARATEQLAAAIGEW